MKTLRLVLIAIVFFCTIDFTIIQSGLFVQCKPIHDEYSAENLTSCEQTSENIQQSFGFVGSIGIAFIVGIVTIMSRKKGIILASSIMGLTISFIIAYQIMISSSTMPPGVMRQMNTSDIILMDFVRSPLWVYLFAAAILGSIACLVAALRNKIVRLK